MSAPTQPIPVMKGGAREQLLDVVKKYMAPLNIYVGILLFLGIVYVRKVPKRVAYAANSFLGRIVLFTLTLLVADMYSWIYALLMGLFVVLLLAVAPRTLHEGFQSKPDPDMDVKLVTQKKKWWSEQVFDENPIGIEEEKVRTQAIQDSSNSSNSNTSSQ